MANKPGFFTECDLALKWRIFTLGDQTELGLHEEGNGSTDLAFSSKNTTGLHLISNRVVQRKKTSEGLVLFDKYLKDSIIYLYKATNIIVNIHI